MEYGLVALWMGVYLALLLAGLPLAAVLFPRLADRGVGVAIPLAATILWFVGYLLGHVSLSLAVPAGVVVLLALAAAAFYRRRPAIDTAVVGETAAVFAVAFLFLVAIRAVDPAVHPIGGEKFLDFGLLRSLLRAETLPPEDMWFAGEPVSYYYGGHLLASLLTRLTGTAPRFAYNLALAGFYAMLVTAAYGLAGSLAAHRGTPRRSGAVLGALFVGIASNLSTPVELLAWLLPDGVVAAVAGLLSVDPTVVNPPAEFNYWDASRVIEGTINEFPLFAFLNGDLHAHMMSTPFLLLVGALCFSYYLTPESALRRRRLLVAGLLPPLAGLLAVVNTWSFPTAGGLTALTLLFAPSDPRTLLPGTLRTRLTADDWRADESLRTLVAVGGGALVVAVGVLWSLPFWLGTASTRSVAVLPDRSPLGPLVLVHGTFLLVFVPYVLRHAVPRLTGRWRLAAAASVAVVVAVGVAVDAAAVAVFAPLLVVGWLLLRLTERATVAAGADAGVASTDGGAEASTARGTEPADDGGPPLDRPGFELVLLVAGAGLLLLVEFVYIEEQAAPGRFNTVFKTYMQIWVLWAVAAGAALAHLCYRHRPTLALSGERWGQAMRAFAVVLLVSASVYGAFALANHFDDDGAIARTDDPTLDATAFVATAHPGEAPAIRWLDNRTGRPTIVSAPGGYNWNGAEGDGASAAASLTGLPTVVGWHHEIGYRGEDAYTNRTADVRRIYVGSPERQAELLRAYNVSYIYVGPAERATYADITVRNVPGVTVELARGDVVIYGVERDALPRE
ncbi:DUF2298 domain-containing protein [Halorientalis litorea]|jgi:YYY domain-containing protein|uniref:DUF2298 domain-containing protein n=1 Tax=Halorientalis litorea TaxID=2931977 RepID=UPI001FF312C0|nr:DUF2298 domain-containing protein [Halorientalis litorea]